MPSRSAFAALFAAPENRSALAAVQALARSLLDPQAEPVANPLFLHGPTGSGKTTLVAALADEVSRADRTVQLQSALDLDAECDADLLIIEDVQHLPQRASETLARLIDERQRRRLPLVCTALVGPARLTHRGVKFSARLTNRLAGGLVVALEPLQVPSRWRFLTELAQQHKLTVADDVLDWLAGHLTGGGRQLEGALHQLETLQKLQRRPLNLDDVREQFEPLAGKPTVERILKQVSAYFQVPARQLCSARRQRHLLLPRQIGMYLARQLTPLSLQQIGACFGGRDHTTVRHACKKVEAALQTDATLSGVVKQMHAALA